MAAPLGFKTFNSGDVLTAADTNGYLMQGVWTFANAAARTAVVTSPQEGNVSFLKDTNSFEIYDGAAWVAYGSGDITGVTAGTGLTGGGTSGTVTVSLDSTAVIAPTIVDAKGDLIAATAADTVARLAVGTNGQVLTADSTTATGLKWGSSSPSYTWTAFTPTVKQSSTLTITDRGSKYVSIDKVLIIKFLVSIGSSGTVGNTILFDIPASISYPLAYNGLATGTVRLYDASAATWYCGIIQESGSGAPNSFILSSGLNKAYPASDWGNTGSEFAIALASGDYISATVVMERN